MNRSARRLFLRQHSARDRRLDGSPVTTTPIAERVARRRKASRIAAASRRANR